jgi:L-alanine-DL-glutamate epimerase-like enolase superfamily enzyme
MTISGPRTYVFIKIIAEDGRYGIGEAYGTPAVGVKEQVETIAPFLVGKNLWRST